MHNKRYDDFLHSYNFYVNSIEFRIFSSRALEKWKNVQAFQLNQLINGKFFFQQDRREVLLLKYDIWSRFLYEVENLCIELSGNQDVIRLESVDMKLIVKLAEKACAKYKNILTEEYKDNFDASFVKIWLVLHSDVEKYVISKINSLSGLKYVDFFTKMVDVLSEVMQYTLLEIHELDSLFCKTRNMCKTEEGCDRKGNCNYDTKIPFVIVSDFTNRFAGEMGTCLIENKLKISKLNFDFESVYIKNYTDQFVEPELLTRIENLDINIDLRKSFCKF